MSHPAPTCSTGARQAKEDDLLVAAPDAWDEACFAVPAVRALIASGLGVGILCPPRQEAFWKTIAGLEVMAVSPDVKPMAAAISGGRWQAALVWEAGPFATAIQKAGIARRIGPAEGKLAKQLTHPVPIPPGPPEHRVQFYLRPVAEMGITTTRPEFFAPVIGDSTRPKHSILLVPDSDFGPSHEWPIARWREVLQSLRELRLEIGIACQPGSRGWGEQLAADAGDDIATHRLTGQALDFLATQRLVLAADGTLPHLASHAGATCITLFGPNDPAWKRPLGIRHKVLRQHVECAPCLLAKCPLDLRCQHELDAARVIRAVRDFVEPSCHE